MIAVSRPTRSGARPGSPAARMCDDHLAGAVGVTLTEALIGRGLLAERGGAYLMEPEGAAEFAAFGIDVDGLERRTRPLLRPCLDWSERRYHLAGILGAVLTRALAERRWITTREASRIVMVTEAGEAGCESGSASTWSNSRLPHDESLVVALPGYGRHHRRARRHRLVLSLRVVL